MNSSIEAHEKTTVGQTLPKCPTTTPTCRTDKRDATAAGFWSITMIERVKEKKHNLNSSVKLFTCPFPVSSSFQDEIGVHVPSWITKQSMTLDEAGNRELA